jgi:transcriptional regulator with XRE-family HTH domain
MSEKIRIRDARKIMGLSQIELASALGITQSYLSKIERCDALSARQQTTFRPFIELLELYKKYVNSLIILQNLDDILPVLFVTAKGKIYSLSQLYSLIEQRISSMKSIFLSGDMSKLCDDLYNNIIFRLARFAEPISYSSMEEDKVCTFIDVSSPQIPGDNKFFTIEYSACNISFRLMGNIKEFLALYLGLKFPGIEMLGGEVMVGNGFLRFRGTELFIDPSPICTIIYKFINDKNLDIPFRLEKKSSSGYEELYD